MRIQNDIYYGSDPLQALDLYIPDCLSDGYRSIIHFHGGGLTGGGKRRHPYIDDLVSFGYVFADCDYRLRPKVTYEEILSDAAKAVRKAIDSFPLSHRAGKIFIAGDSAGGCIVMELLFRPEYLRAVGIEPEQIGGYVLDDPMFRPDRPSFDLVNGYITDLLEDPTCPLSSVTEQSYIPPVLFTTYGKSIHGFPEFTHFAVATLFRLGFGDRVRLEYFPGYPHGGNFEAPPIDGKNAYSVLTHRFYCTIPD